MKRYIINHNGGKRAMAIQIRSWKDKRHDYKFIKKRLVVIYKNLRIGYKRKDDRLIAYYQGKLDFLREYIKITPEIKVIESRFKIPKDWYLTTTIGKVVH